MAIRYECVRGWVYVLSVSVLFNDRLSNWPGCTLPLPQRLLGIGTSPHATLPEQAGINNEWMFRWEFYKQVCSFFSPRSIDWRSCFWLCRLLNINNMNLSKVFFYFFIFIVPTSKTAKAYCSSLDQPTWPDLPEETSFFAQPINLSLTMYKIYLGIFWIILAWINVQFPYRIMDIYIFSQYYILIMILMKNNASLILVCFMTHSMCHVLCS